MRTYGESYNLSAESLPEPRHDLHYETLNAAALRTLMDEQLVVLNGFFSAYRIEALRRRAGALLRAQLPIAAARKAVEAAAPTRVVDALPQYMRRQPVSCKVSRRYLFGPLVATMFDELQTLNARLYQDPKVANEYGTEAFPLTNGFINITSPRKWFVKHQDSIGKRGFGFSPQTSPTLWHIHATETMPDADDYTFLTQPGDVVVVRERAESIEETVIDMGRGYTTYDPRGSVVHSGLNLTDEMRYTINLFHIEHPERY